MEDFITFQLACISLACISVLWAFSERRRRLAASKIAEQAKTEAETAVQARWDYERALGLPFYSESKTEDALFDRAYEGDDIASVILQERMSRALNKEIGDAVEKSAHHGRALI